MSTFINSLSSLLPVFSLTALALKNNYELENHWFLDSNPSSFTKLYQTGNFLLFTFMELPVLVKAFLQHLKGTADPCALLNSSIYRVSISNFEGSFEAPDQLRKPIRILASKWSPPFLDNSYCFCKNKTHPGICKIAENILEKSRLS